MDTQPTPALVAATATFRFDPPLDHAGPVPRDVAERLQALLGSGSVTVTWPPGPDGATSWTAVVPGHGDPAGTLGLVERSARAALWEVAGLQPRLVELLARDVAELRARAEVGDPAPDLVGVDEFCELLDVGRSRFYVLAARPSFPRPVARGVYLGPAARRWAAEHKAAAGRGGIEDGPEQSRDATADARPACSECGHRAWSHGDQDGNPADGAPCHQTYAQGRVPCSCPTGYRDHMAELAEQYPRAVGRR